MCWIVKALQSHLLSPQVSKLPKSALSSGLASKTGFSTSDASDRLGSLVVKACVAQGRNQTEEGAVQQHYFWAQCFPRNGINILKWFHNNASKAILSILMKKRKSNLCNIIMKIDWLCPPLFDRLLDMVVGWWLRNPVRKYTVFGSALTLIYPKKGIIR